MEREQPSRVAAAIDAVLARRPRSVVLVEGRSDRAAVLALARRRGHDLAGERVEVVAMSGVTNVGHFVTALGDGGAGLDVAGLFDEGEESIVRHWLAEAGYDLGVDLADHGFHVCRRDLEDELIRALGVDEVLAVVDREGESGRLRTFRRQPDQRGRAVEAQLHRFLGVASGRKLRYGRLLVEALGLDRVPEPLDAVLARAVDTSTRATR